MYRIQHWFPRRGTGGASFSVLLKEGWFKLLETTTLNQEKMDNLIANMGSQMLAGNGWSNITDPNSYIRVWWNDGVPTIQVPGSACTLSYEPHSQIGTGKGEKMLVCHNMDTLNQASLALTVFLRIADYLELGI